MAAEYARTSHRMRRQQPSHPCDGPARPDGSRSRGQWGDQGRAADGPGSAGVRRVLLATPAWRKPLPSKVSQHCHAASGFSEPKWLRTR